MSPFTIDPDGGSDELPAGQHDVQIVKAVAGQSGKGNPNIRVELEDRHGRELAEWVTITPAALWKVEELWSAAGLAWPDQGGEIDEADLVGRTVHIEVAEEEYNGRTRPRVREWTPASGVEIAADSEGLDTSGGGFAEAAGIDDEVRF
jgi:hypothetical protein